MEEKRTVTLQIDRGVLRMYQISGYLRGAGVVAGFILLLYICMKQVNTLNFIAEHQNADALTFAVSNNIHSEIALIILGIIILAATVVRCYLRRRYFRE